MASLLQPVQGMSDITAPEVAHWQRMEAIARDVMERHGFTELRTPLLEYEDLFTRSIGDTTDVVQKEMYSFERSHHRLCLRPEGTAGVMRHAAGLGPIESAGARWYYIGPMFRCERPQAGRKRQFHQCGVECMEEPSPLVDAEILALQVDLLRAWGVTDCEVHLNTRGAGTEHAAVAAGLRAALAAREGDLCEDCRRRIHENVLRVLDCKNEACRAIVSALPPVTAFMGPESVAYLEAVEAHLRAMSIPYRRDPLLVRGLDYYEHTIWEIAGRHAGSQSALAGGGRYRITLANRAWPGVGFAIGMERVLQLLLESPDASALLPPRRPLLWLVGLGNAAQSANLVLLRTLRAAGLVCRMAPSGSMKSQMRAANKAGAAWTLLRGDDELASGTILLKNMTTGDQRPVPADDALPALLLSETAPAPARP